MQLVATLTFGALYSHDNRWFVWQLHSEGIPLSDLPYGFAIVALAARYTCCTTSGIKKTRTVSQLK